MNILQTKGYDELSQKAAEFIISKVRQNPEIKLGLATGGTPQGLYDKLIHDHKQNFTSYQKVTTFNLDEYVGLEKDHPNSYHFFMKKTLFDHIDIEPSNTYIPNGEVEDLDAECLRYEKNIEELGGIDLQILGIGSNGHIGFNEPGTSFQSMTHIVELTQSTREANARFFNKPEDVPTQAITMGIKSIMNAKEIVLLVSGESKKEAIKQLLSEKVTEQFPASILNTHPNVTVIVDEEALPKLELNAEKGA
ncbi:glucosamine-6-phosphate deaminase [Metabacillus arenae]|uniref:Glucosamine-6-phosphate deaminase n=1 Tax=Metabacillus arenae TaxID=2771434 RepID=A0A926NFG3_9BACI|nr:glucosamine-6-phosphate deaminase [Metabacillus arenae]MBD1380291.1 glucosamine-6-phosphate deaminase [Metabacillus arenae]